MAKKENRHAEHFDKLSASLVSASANIEAPYELPEGWKWEKISNLSDIYTGNSINETVKKEKYTGIKEGLNFIGTKDVDFDGTINYENGVKISDYENFKTVPANTPLLCIEGGSAGKKLGITSEQVCFGNKLCAFVCKNVEPKLVYYYLQTNAFFYSFIKERHGLIGGVSVGTLKNIPFPLPPTLAEQQRIVNRIETMFAKLDHAQKKAQSVLDSFETRKAAILHKAFTGELTANWRKENEVGNESWEEKTLDNCGIWERGRSKHRPRNAPELFGGKYPFIQTGDIANADIYINEHKQTLSEFGFQQSRLFPKGTLCITIAANIGKVAILTYDCCFPDSVVGFKPFENVDSKFMYFKINDIQKDLEAMAPATAQKNLNLKLLTSVLVRIPTLPEQQEIVRILDTVLEKESRAKEAAGAVLDQIALLKKSILARAFRGEL